MATIETRDRTRLNVKIWGEGHPVVLIHGWPLSAASWVPVALALAHSGYQAIAYDRRGFGLSDQPWRGYDYDTFADDLADVIAATHAQGAALVGFSMGGGEVARYLSRHGSGGVSRVALISAVVPLLAQAHDNPEGAPPAAFSEMAEGLRADRAHFLRGFFNQFFGQGFIVRPVSQEQLDHAWMQAMQAGLHPTLAAAQAFATTDFRPDLAAFTVPTLVIHGTDDATVPIAATARKVAAAVPHARLIEYQGAAHGLFETHTDRLIADLLAFLGGTEAYSDAAGAPLRQAMVDEATRETIVAPGFA